MPRSMSDPDYVYRPWAGERRLEMSLIHRRRIGVPDGYRQIYGVHVPDEHSEAVKFWASWVARFSGVESAAAFVADLQSGEWAVMPKIETLFRQKRALLKNRTLVANIKDEARKCRP